MSELAREIAERKCPKCGTQGTLRFQMAYACVVCQACMRSFIDPFEVGPWEDGSALLDTVDGKVVSSYMYAGMSDPEGELTLNENVAEFYKYLIATKDIEGE